MTCKLSSRPYKVQLRATVTEAQAEVLLQRLSLLPFNIEYYREQRGALMVVAIACTAAQEKIVLDILNQLCTSNIDSSTGRRFSLGQRVVIRRDDPGPYTGPPAVIEMTRDNSTIPLLDVLRASAHTPT
jgi:hypothetical protein